MFQESNKDDCAEVRLSSKQYPTEKIQMKRTIEMCESRNIQQMNDGKTPWGALPACVLHRDRHSWAKVSSSTIKQKQK